MLKAPLLYYGKIESSTSRKHASIRIFSYNMWQTHLLVHVILIVKIVIIFCCIVYIMKIDSKCSLFWSSKRNVTLYFTYISETISPIMKVRMFM